VYKGYEWSVIKLCGDIKPVVLMGNRRMSTVGGVLLAGALFVPIRGGFTVSTMNLSRAYFSSDTRLNHAAVNPVFSLLYSATHQSRFDTMYRFFSEDEAVRLFGELRDAPYGEDIPALLKVKNPDVHIILLESFSSHLMPVLGGEPVALGLDSIARSGVIWTRFYASSFRTDRGIPAVLSGYPGQPNTSIMKYVSKTENLPSLSRSMVENGGYEAVYYYGGDANFTNQLAYLVGAGFGRVVSDKDFPVSQRLSKWGAHDDVVLERALSEVTLYDASKPKLRVIQTSSSHEPFDVPYNSNGRFADKRAEAFAYADSCVTAYVNALAMRPDWANTLVVLVPDHYGAYPDLTDPVERHRIPLIMTGGALALSGVQSVIGSQTDIAATLLDALGIGHDEFVFSHNLLNPRSPHFAFFADPSYIGMITDDNTLVYSLDAGVPIVDSGDAVGSNECYAKAFLQNLYTDLQSR
ncbi:MAG: LTA synthase family protein, partial [Paramuribaculum sp.]|nr:LTA synthase family protein [Paramuribaculum sp.]